MGAREVTTFSTHLAVEPDTAAAIQHQALSALLFLYKQVLDIDLPWLNDVVRPKRPARLPTVLNEGEVLQAAPSGLSRGNRPARRIQMRLPEPP